MSDETRAADPLTETEARDLQWLQEVYQGDHQRQLTWRAVLTGGVLGMFLSISNLYTTLKLGWAFGVAITACVMSYVLWNALRALTGGRMSQMSLLENNCMQSTASAAGYSTGGTVGSAFAALYVQRFDDAGALAAVDGIEDLTNGLSRKIWQKIAMLEAAARSGD